MLITLTLVFLFTLLILFYFYFKNINADYWKKQNIAYVKKTNPFGELFDYLFTDKPLSVIYKDIYDQHPNDDHVGIFLGRKPALLIKDPVNIQAVLSGNFLSFYNRGIPLHSDDKLADNVLFIEDYPRWKLIRQKVSPLFTSAKLKNMFYIIEHCSKDFVKYVEAKKEVEPNSINILYTFSTSSVATSVFGIDPQLKNAMDSPFVKMTTSAFDTGLRKRLKNVIFESVPELINIFKIKLFGAYEKFFIGVFKNVLRNREMENVPRHDFMDMCKELQKNGTLRDPTTNYEVEPTDELLAAQAFFFFLAGIDTTATTMNFTLYELSRNPEILKLLHQEIDNVFNKCGDTIPYDEIINLKYMDMVLNESMRKFPTVGLYRRHCTKDTILPNSGIKMKKGTLAIIPVFALHRDARNFPDPERFDPERFSPENIDKITKFTYLPFNEGNRICLGARFARLQMKTGLTYLLRRYTLEPVERPIKFESSTFSIRDPNMTFKFIDRPHISQ